MLVIRQTGLELPAHAHVVEGRADDGLQGFALEGLGEVVEGARRETLADLLRRGGRGLHDHRDGPKAVVLDLQQHDAVHARHHAIQSTRSKLLSDRLSSPGRLAGLHHHQIEIHLVQVFGNDIQIEGLVIHDEYACLAHSWAMQRARRVAQRQSR
jgi:hypothetical protein